MKYFIVGGAGFIGSNLIKCLLKEEPDSKITVYDNFSSGKRKFLKGLHITIVQNDIKNLEILTEVMKDHDIVYHFASNPDIAKAMIEPSIDFWNGTLLMNNVLEAMRLNNIKRLLYASGSGVYGDTGNIEVNEDYSPKLPVSMYGSSKLACEALACAYCYMFDMNISVFRFANVIGVNQTHGVILDFINKLLKNPKELKILGDGRQSKSYVHISDILNAVRCVERKITKAFNYYNVATEDYMSVKEIADVVVKQMNLKNVIYIYSGGRGGWKGDVPVIRLNSKKIRSLGWISEYSSVDAMYLAVKENL